MPSQFFGNDHDGTSFEDGFGFHVNKHGNRLQPLFLHWIVAFGVTRGCLLVRGIPRFHGSLEPVTQTWNLFSTSSFDHNFQPNDNQTFTVNTKSTLVLYRKSLCVFSGFGICPRRKVMWKKVLRVFRTRGSTSYFQVGVLNTQNSNGNMPNMILIAYLNENFTDCNENLGLGVGC